MLKSGCPATDVTVRGRGPGAAEPAACNAWRAEAIGRIVAARPAIVVLGSASTHLGRKERRPSRLDVSLEEWRDGTRRTLASLAAAQIPMLVLRDTPLPPFDVPTCLARSVRHTWYLWDSCEIRRDVALDPRVFDAERAGAQALPGVHFFDVTDRLCDAEVCATTQKNVVIYADASHLTASFVDSLAPLLQTKLSELVHDE